MSDYEPPAEMVEEDALRVHATYKQAVGYVTPWDDAAAEWRDFCRAEARFVLRRQHSREKGLLVAMRDAASLMSAGSWPAGLDALKRALAAHAALDAAPEPTLLEAAKAMLGEMDSVQGLSLLPKISALKAAVEREEKR